MQRHLQEAVTGYVHQQQLLDTVVLLDALLGHLQDLVDLLLGQNRTVGQGESPPFWVNCKPSCLGRQQDRLPPVHPLAVLPEPIGWRRQSKSPMGTASISVLSVGRWATRAVKQKPGQGGRHIFRRC